MTTRLWDGLIAEGGAPSLASTGEPVSAFVDRLAAGAAPEALAAEAGLSPRGLIAVVAFDAVGDDSDDAGPALTQASPRRPGLAPPLSEPALAKLFPGLSRPERLALAAGLLQMHDFWDDSHHAAQEADDLGESSVSAYWHGVAHRREPDAGNAGYWFRRVGRHRLFVPLAEAVGPLLDDHAAIAARLLPRGAWDPYAFVSLCTSGGTGDAPLARRIQRVELALLLDASLPPA
jgi:hypothetical protein